MPIVTKLYLIKKSDVTAAMRTTASASIEYEFLKAVGSANITSIDTAVASLNDDDWMSSDGADVTSAEGYQADGITLPKKAVDS